MKTIEILGDDREPVYTKTVEGCRGILISEGKILLSYYRIEDQYLIPGGGIEVGESYKDTNEMRYVAYYREWLALTEYTK